MRRETVPTGREAMMLRARVRDSVSRAGAGRRLAFGP